MIQRVQTIYLLIVVAICISMFYLPIYVAEFHCKGAEIAQTLKLVNYKAEYSLGLEQGLGQLKTFPYLYGTLNIVILALAIVAIGFYKNRGRQLFLSRIILIFSLIYIGLIYYTVFFGVTDIYCEVKGKMASGAYVPLLSPFLLLLAGMGIRKDIKTVKSADRLR